MTTGFTYDGLHDCIKLMVPQQLPVVPNSLKTSLYNSLQFFYMVLKPKTLITNRIEVGRDGEDMILFIFFLFAIPTLFIIHTLTLLKMSIMTKNPHKTNMYVKLGVMSNIQYCENFNIYIYIYIWGWNSTRMLWAILNKSWEQNPMKQQLYNHLPHISKTI